MQRHFLSTAAVSRCTQLIWTILLMELGVYFPLITTYCEKSVLCVALGKSYKCTDAFVKCYNQVWDVRPDGSDGTRQDILPAEKSNIPKKLFETPTINFSLSGTEKFLI